MHLYLFSELERKISVRSTREELIRKGVLKETLEVVKSATADGQSIEQTSAEINNDQETKSTVIVEQNHVDQNGRLSPGSSLFLLQRSGLQTCQILIIVLG